MTKKKGELSFLWIIENCIKVFNEIGLDITLNQLSKELSISRGRISHFFPTKEHLLVAISNEYEKEFGRIVSSFKFTTDENFLFEQLKLYSLLMDNQFRFRCVTIYAAGVSSSRSEMISQINSRFSGTKERFKALTEKLIEFGYLDSMVLHNSNFDVFRFKFITIFTSWIIHLEIYDKEKGYTEMKSVYLKAIASCFLDFATPKTKKLLDEIKYTTL